MADTKKTVGATGDYTTIQGAIDWFDTNWTPSGTDLGLIEIEDAANFDEEIVVSGMGTTTETSYIHIYAKDSVRHSGVAGTDHARMVTSKSVENRIITISQDFTRITGLELYVQSSGGSDEGIRITSGIEGVVIDSCIIHSDLNAADQDGIYTGNYDTGSPSYPTVIKNCVIYDFQRAGINFQSYGVSEDTVARVVHCFFNNTGTTDTESGIHIKEANVTQVMVANCLSKGGGSADDYVENNVPHTFGARNISEDTSAETIWHDSYGSVTLTDNNSASGEVYTVANESTDDYTSEQNDGTGTDRMYRAGIHITDCTTDILGNDRHPTTPCIGPFEIGSVTVPWAGPKIESHVLKSDIGSSGSVLVDFSTHRPDDDLYLAHIVYDGTTEIDTYNGFATVYDADSGTAIHHALLWIKGNSLSAQYDFTRDTANTEGYSTAGVRISGADTTTPIGAKNVSTDQSSTVTFPAITATSDDSLILRVYCGEYIPWSNEGGGAMQYASLVVDTNINDIWCSYETSPGNGVSTGTSKVDLGFVGQWTAMTVEIMPAATASRFPYESIEMQRRQMKVLLTR